MQSVSLTNVAIVLSMDPDGFVFVACVAAIAFMLWEVLNSEAMIYSRFHSLPGGQVLLMIILVQFRFASALRMAVTNNPFTAGIGEKGK